MKFRLDLAGYVAITTGILVLSVSSIAASGDTESTDDQHRRILQQSILSKNGDVEILVREHGYPPGWQAPTHYHDGDLFIYVVEGEFEISTDDIGTIIYTSGEAMQMAAETIMDARNVSQTEPLKLVIFQIGEPGGPFLVPIDSTD
jgi:quercetin dioxygenase-like cupin family protein